MNIENMTMEGLQARRKAVSNQISALNNQQMAQKILLNSAYGALA